MRYPVGVENTILNTVSVIENQLQDSYNTHQGLLLHNSKIFIFVPILHSDIVNNLMQIIYQEIEIYPSIFHMSDDPYKKEDQKQRRKLMSSIANNLIN